MRRTKVSHPPGARRTPKTDALGKRTDDSGGRQPVGLTPKLCAFQKVEMHTALAPSQPAGVFLASAERPRPRAQCFPFMMGFAFG